MGKKRGHGESLAKKRREYSKRKDEQPPELEGCDFGHSYWIHRCANRNMVYLKIAVKQCQRCNLLLEQVKAYVKNGGK